LKPDAIVLDLRMEKPDTGWQLLELLRLDPDLATVPVILCSADVTRLHERQQALAAHNCRVLDKPFHLDELLGVLREILPSPV
ncbi:MAG TPA: response regulator, partial [Chloroflexota bacterium]|nr:response regulator [Chloroflexota bacterium]